MTEAQRRLMHARDSVRAKLIDPVTELLDAALGLAAEANTRAETAEKVLEELRPVWAQGWTSDSQAAQASSNALAEVWQLLGAHNQTEALARLRLLIDAVRVGHENCGQDPESIFAEALTHIERKD